MRFYMAEIRQVPISGFRKIIILLYSEGIFTLLTFQIVKIKGSSAENFAGSGVPGRQDGLGTEASFMTPGAAVIDSKNVIFASGILNL